ncbi:hypothetical protein ACFX13_046407 [Malus domestica]
MASDNPKAVEAEPPPSSSKERIVFPTLLVGILGGGAGLVSKHRKVMGLPTSCVTDAANFAKVTACYCGKFHCFVLKFCSLASDLSTHMV